MKRKLLLLAMCLYGFLGYSQIDMSNEILRKRASNNLKYISNDFNIKYRVQIDSKGLIIYNNSDHTAIDLSLSWNDAAHFLEILNHEDHYGKIKTFLENKKYILDEPSIKSSISKYNYLPTEWKGLSVALDPGHFGGNMKEAKLENRYAKFRAEDIGKKKDISFYEADLNYNICLILKKLIENKGGKVLITRPYGTSSLKKSFEHWLKEDFEKDLKESYSKGNLRKEQYDFLKNTNDEDLIFESLYKFLDFRKRIELIHAFKPDITFIVHLNAKEGNRRFGNRYLMPVSENYNMAFVPGGFTSEELAETNQIIDFTRLLLSEDIQNSIRLADFLLAAQSEILSVARIPKENDIKILRDFSVITPFEGVYARNLAMTRKVKGILVYGETLYQDNLYELLLLNKKDYEIHIPNMGKKKISFRCKQIADSYFKGLNDFLINNVQLQKME